MARVHWLARRVIWRTATRTDTVPAVRARALRSILWKYFVMAHELNARCGRLRLAGDVRASRLRDGISAGGGHREISDRLRSAKKIQNARAVLVSLHHTTQSPSLSPPGFPSVKMADVKKSKSPKEFARTCLLRRRARRTRRRCVVMGVCADLARPYSRLHDGWCFCRA